MTRTEKMKILKEVQRKLAALVYRGQLISLELFDQEVRELREQLYFIQDAAETSAPKGDFE